MSWPDEERHEGTYPSAEDYPPPERPTLSQWGTRTKQKKEKMSSDGTNPHRGSLWVEERGAPGCFCPASQKGWDWEGGKGHGVLPPQVLPLRKGAGNYAQLAGSRR